MINVTYERKVTELLTMSVKVRGNAGDGDTGTGELNVVKSRDREAAVRLKRFQVEEQERQVGQIETMIEEFSRMVADLDQEIAAEHRRTGVEDMNDFRYSIYARSARQRRTKMVASIADLQGQLNAARAALDLARAELVQEEERLEREAAAGRDAGTRAAR